MWPQDPPCIFNCQNEILLIFVSEIQPNEYHMVRAQIMTELTLHIELNTGDSYLLMGFLHVYFILLNLVETIYLTARKKLNLLCKLENRAKKCMF